MDKQTNAINSSLMIVGAIVLLGVVTWVVFAVSQPLVPNTGTNPEVNGAVATTSMNQPNTIEDNGSLIDDPTGQSHTEESGVE